jgi:hypothetical protein
VVICLSTSAATSVAHAFNDPLFFGKNAFFEGGTEGRWFTGGPTDGYDCGVCHTSEQGEKLVVEGLPMNGYVTDMDYVVRITWPLTAARQRRLFAQQPPPARYPGTSLVAEFVAETADDSGTVTQETLPKLTDPELCYSDAMPKRRRFGYALYRQPHNGEPTAVSACQGTNLTRCLVAVRSCGAEEVRINWHSPKFNQGAIWFSASFVSTDALSLTPDGDQVSTVTIPIAPAGTEFESKLEQSCSLVAWPSATRSGRAANFAPIAALAGLLVWRSRQRRRKDKT